MNYIYDLVVNLNKKYYHFYDWNKNDIYTHIKKIPIIKISKENIYRLINGKTINDYSLLQMIKDKTELFNNNSLLFKYATLLSTDEKIICIVFDKYGKILYKSDLNIIDEEDILETINKVNYYELGKINTKYYINSLTRNEQYKLNNIKNKLKKINIDNLNYLYYEIYNKEPKNKMDLNEIFINKNINILEKIIMEYEK